MLLPAIGLIIGGLAIAFSQITGKGVDEVLFSGQDQLPGLVGQAGTWSLAALAWLIVFKGLAYGLSLGSFRGGPTFPALFLGAAAGIMCSHLAGFPLSAAVPVGMGAAIVAVLRLPLAAVVLATLLTSHAGPKVEPLIILGVVVAYVVTLVMTRPPAPTSAPRDLANPGTGAKRVTRARAGPNAGQRTPERLADEGHRRGRPREWPASASGGTQSVWIATLLPPHPLGMLRCRSIASTLRGCCSASDQDPSGPSHKEPQT